MRKKDWLMDALIVAAALLLILAILSLMGRVMRARAADAEAREIMERAQERIDLYEAAGAPATELFSTVVVYEARPVVETPEPSPDPSFEPAEDWYIESLPLDKQLQKIVFDAACDNGVDYFTALGLIQVESNFRVDAVSSCGCYGLMQLHTEWFPSGLSPEENVRAGMEYLGQLMETYQGNIEAALRAFNRGYDDGARGYTYAVLGAAEDIMRQSGVVVP